MARASKTAYREWLHLSTLRLGRLHFLFIIPFVVQIIAYDAWHVLVPQVIMQRWISVGALLVITAIVWYLAHNQKNDVATYKRLIFALLLADIAIAAFNIYIQRGMASRAVMLFAIPIVASGVLLSSAAVFTTAAISSAAYAATAVSYFVINFNEGYKSELYGEVGFYCAVFFVLAALLSIIVRFGRNITDS